MEEMMQVGPAATKASDAFKSSDYIGMLRDLAPEIATGTPGRLSLQKLTDLHTIIQIGEAAMPGLLSFDDVCRRGMTVLLLASQTRDSVFRCYHDALCERFWRGDFGIEDAGAVRVLLVEAGADGHAFDELIASGEGVRQCRAIAAAAEERGVFGVPTFVLDETGELFWGTDRVWLLRERLSEKL